MKKICIAVILGICAIQLSAQDRSCINGNVLFIDEAIEGSTNYSLVLYKSDIAGIKHVSCNKGEVKGYTIAFMFDGSYFSKVVVGNGFNQDIGKKIQSLPDGTKIYFDDVTVGEVKFKGAYVTLKSK